MKALLIVACLILTMTGSAFAHGWGRGGHCGGRGGYYFHAAPRCERGHYHDRWERRYDRGYRYGGCYGGHRGW